MRLKAAAVLLTAAAAVPAESRAGAWPMAPGHTQAILKYERAEADEAFDLDGSIVPLFAREDEQLSLFVEHGLTGRLTLQAEAAYTRGEDAFARYGGRGPTSLGLRYAVLHTPRSVVSVYLGGVAAGEGRNAGYAPPAQGEGDVEFRLLAGRASVWRQRPVFAEVQLARFERSGLPDETRMDSTLGVQVNPRWLLLLQSYAGVADGGDDAPLWIKSELSVARQIRNWRVQAGWRGSVAGRNSPVEQGPVLAVWRSF